MTVFDRTQIEHLPAAARLYLTHAIAEGTPLASSVRLETLFRLRPEDRAPALLHGDELLEPRAFVWRARTRFAGLPVRVVDDYRNGRGGVTVKLLGLIPIVRANDADTARSARGRLAAEAIWLPTALLPQAGAAWQGLGDACARVSRVIDGEEITLELHVDERGSLRAMNTLRHGDVGVDGWRAIPYGVRCDEEATFDGYTIPTRAVGGWWFGSERYDPETAGRFRIAGAAFSWSGLPTASGRGTA